MKYHPHEAQALFTQAVEAIITQGRPSLLTKDDSAPFCAYRGECGLKCAVGHLIPDSKYQPDMEGESVSSIARNWTGLANLLPHTGWLLELQMAHDQSAETVGADFIREFRWRAAKVAGKYLFDMPC